MLFKQVSIYKQYKEQNILKNKNGKVQKELQLLSS